MSALNARISQVWVRVQPQFLPFADAGTPDLPLSRLLRLSLFQVTVGMAVALLVGTLNRVMIVELGVPAWLVSAMIALPLLFAPFRALIGYRSDTHRSALGWRRVPFIWMGTLLQFGGLAIMPFALIVLSGDTHGPLVIGQVGAALAFLLIGAGFHTTQTTGLALATDLAPAAVRPRVVALMYVMLLVGVMVSALAFGVLLARFSELRLIQVIQGAALVTMVLNGIALWKQEARDPGRTTGTAAAQPFRASWRAFAARPRARRFLVAVAVGTAAFNMQDVLLEPYGGQVLRLSVGETTALTALMALGALIGIALTARALARAVDPHRLSACGALVGLAAFCAVLFAAPLHAAWMFCAGTAGIGLGGACFAVGTLSAAMALDGGGVGLAIGAWGAVQALAGGGAIAGSGFLRDSIQHLSHAGVLGPVLTGPAVGYGCVYLIELVLLFVSLAVIGPLVQLGAGLASPLPRAPLGIAER